MAIEVTSATAEDIAWLTVNDQHVSGAWVRRCVLLGEYLVAKQNSLPVGFLRFSFFWGVIPYLELIHVLADMRRRGIGSALFQAWEQSMYERGVQLLMTTSMGDEPESQAWHRRNGFTESGSLKFGRLQSTPEVFFIKAL